MLRKLTRGHRTLDDLTRGHRALDAFLKKYGLTHSDCARAMDISTAAVHQWFEGKRPTEAKRQGLEVWTNSEVPAPWWLTDEECQEIARVTRYQPPAPVAALPPAPARKARRSAASASQR